MLVPKPASGLRAADPGEVLNGWKEIASHLGKSARSVQRWERDLGLPVHRIRTPEGGSIVYALRPEVDAWRESHRELSGALDEPSSPNGEPDDDVATDTAGVEPPSVPERESPAWRWWLSARVPLWAAGLLVGLAATVTWLWARPPIGGVVATWEYEGHEVRAYTQGGRMIWAHDFGRPVSRPNTYTRDNSGVDSANGDTVVETLVPIRFAPSRGDSTAESDALAAFAPDGRLLWSVQPALRLRVGDEVFEGPWQVYAAQTGMTASGARTWIAFNHHTWWPGFVLEVAPDGRQRLMVVQGGRFWTLSFWRAGDRSVLMAGGALRERHETVSSAVMVDVNGPPVVWPASGPSHLTCDGCPTSSPVAVLTFPTSHVVTALRRTHPWVSLGKVLPEGFQLAIREGFGNSGTLIALDRRFNALGYERTDQYWSVHRDLEQQGLITHTVEDCPDRLGPAVVRRWTPDEGWQAQPVSLRISKALPARPAD